MAKRSRNVAASLIAMGLVAALLLVGHSDSVSLAPASASEAASESAPQVAVSEVRQAALKPLPHVPKLSEAQAEELLDGADVEPNALLACVSGGTSADEIRATLTAEMQDGTAGLDITTVELVADDVVHIVVNTDEQSLASAISQVSAFDFVQSVQPNYVYARGDGEQISAAGEDDPATTASSTSALTEDTYSDLQWNLQSINVAPVWQYGITGEGVSVAVIDKGFDAEHPDLEGKYVGAYNTADGSNEMRRDAHGLEVAGVITANQNNDYATSGVAPGAQVVPITVGNGEYSSLNLIKAFAYILRVREQYNIRVVNMSFGFDWSKLEQGDPLVYQKIDEAYAAGVVSVASAGNNGSTVNHCPCDYGTVVGVIGLEYEGFDAQAYEGFDASRVVRSKSSNYNAEGKTSKGISAPGFKVPNLVLDDRANNYGLSWGTSYAAPHVCAVLALMFEANPQLTPTQAISILYTTARDAGEDGWDETYGYGTLDASRAVAAAKSSAWLEGSQYVPVGEQVAYRGADGTELTALVDERGIGKASVQDGTGVVTAEQSGVMHVRGERKQGDSVRAEVNAVGPIEGPTSLAWEACETYAVDQPYSFVYAWSVDGGPTVATSSTFAYKPVSGGEHTITAALVADPSVVLSRSVTVREATPGPVVYRAYAQGRGWEETWHESGQTSGAPSQARGLRSIQLKLGEQVYTGGIQYRVCGQGGAWEGAWHADGEPSSAQGDDEKITAVQIALTGEMAERYDVWYRVCVQDYGWLGWATGGERAGTLTSGKQVEAIEVRLQVKGQRLAGAATEPFVG